MPLFEFENGRLVPAQFGRTVGGSLTSDVIEAISRQVLELIGRPLFPITWRSVSHADGQGADPRLIALDVSGQVVSIEIVDHLDSPLLMASLSRLAQTAALSWSDLAHEYPGDVEGFKAGWLRFRQSMPPAAGAGPRLILVVGSVDPTIRPALDVLASSGVEVHEVSLRQMSNGRTFLDVRAVGARVYSHATQVIVGSSVQSTPQLTAHSDFNLAVDVDPVEVSIKEKPSPDLAPVVEEYMAMEEPVEEYKVEEVSTEQVADDTDWVADLDEETVSRETVSAQTRVEAVEETAPAAEEDGPLHRDAEGLRMLAAMVGEDIPLVALPSTAIPEGFILGAEGRLHLSGAAFLQPQDAMNALNLTHLDGWDELYIVDFDGPTLAEALAEVNRELRQRNE